MASIRMRRNRSQMTVVAPIAPDEPERLDTLHAYRLLDTEVEERFDSIVSFAGMLFDVPTALISLIDADRQWFKAKHGLEACETGRDESFCAHAIQQHDVFVVLDALQDTRFRDNPLVLDDPKVRFYAGAPLRAPNGKAIGTLCLLDDRPRDAFSARDRQLLLTLASVVMSQCELRMSATDALNEAAEALSGARERHERFLEDVLESVHDAIIACDGAGRITVFNSSARALYGLTEPPATVDAFLNAFHLFDADGATPIARHDSPLRCALRGEIVTDAEHVNAPKRGGKFHARTNAWPLRQVNGGVTGAVVSIADITVARKLQSQYRQAQKMEAVGQLTGGLAHDFNNLLAVIMGNLQLLERALGDDPKALKRARAALDAARRGADLTQRLLAVSRREDLAPQPIDPGEMISSMADLLTRAIGQTIDLSLSTPSKPWPVLVDRSSFESAILNLAINSRDAMDGEGRLTIAAENYRAESDMILASSVLPAGDYLKVSVSDSGSGMTAEVRERVFEPFFTTKDAGEGSGLGLSMVFGFVKQSGGHVNIYSEVGHGTSVSMFLPRLLDESDVDTTPTGPPCETATVGATAAQRILIAEDSEDVREVAVAMLEDMGYEVVEAEDGPSALATLEAANGGFDLLFTDIVMPNGMHGPALAKAATSAFPHLKVLFTSGYAESAMLRELDEHPDFMLVSKPYRIAELEVKIRAALEGRVVDGRPLKAAAS